MAENFEPITTQEQFEERIRDRLNRDAKKYEGYTSPSDLEKIKSDYDKQIADLTKASEDQTKKYADYDKKLAEKDSKIKAYESASVKTRIAHEVGLPYELSGRLSGETEEDIRADAEALVKIIGKKHAPLAEPSDDSDVKAADSKQSALKSLAHKLNGGD